MVFGKSLAPALSVALVCLACSPYMPASWAAPLSISDQLDGMQMQIVHFGSSMDMFDRLEQIISQDPKNSQAHYVLGLALKKAGYSELADEQFKLVQQTDAVYTRHIFDEFRTALDKEDLMAASEYSEFIRNVDPDNARLMYLDAVLLIGEGHLGEASAKLTGAIRKDPTLPGVSSELARIQIARGQYSQARVLAQHDLKASPRHHQANLALGESLLGLNKYAEAVEPLKIAYETGGIAPGAGRVYADDLIRLGRYADALEPCLVDMGCESRKSRLDETKLMVEAIMPRLTSAEMSRAVSAAAQRLKGTNFGWRMYVAFADVLDHTGNYVNAVIVRTKGLVLEPNYTRGYYRMAQSLEQCRNYTDATKFYAKAYDHEPNNPEYLLSYMRSKERLLNRSNDIGWQLKDWLKRKMSPPLKRLNIDS